MAAEDLSNQLIKNTYNRVVQVYPSPTGSEFTKLYDLTGNEVTKLEVQSLSGSFSGSVASSTGVSPDIKCYSIAMSVALG